MYLGCAFLSYTTDESALEALEKLNQKLILPNVIFDIVIYLTYYRNSEIIGVTESYPSAN